jgi:hypothetical protein
MPGKNWWDRRVDEAVVDHADEQVVGSYRAAVIAWFVGRPSQRFRTELEDSVLNVLIGFGFLSDANVVQ